MILLKPEPGVKYHPVPEKGGVMAELKGALIEYPAINDTRKEVHDVAASADAWNRVQVFFREYLK